MKQWVLAFFLLAEAALGMDLSKVDRGIGKEPRYKNQPGYCLLVFGPEAKTRVWLVQDGDKLYVDRNGDGDLTQAGEAVEPSKVRVVNPSYRDRKYVVGRLTPLDKTGPHTDFEISSYSEDNVLWSYVFKLKVNGTVQQFAGWKPVFKSSREKAAVFHFGGPLSPQPLRFSQVSLKEKKPELHLRFITPGLGEFSTVSLGYEAVPKAIEPVALIEWPGAKMETVQLLSRC